MITSAALSSCGTFRWELERIWGFYGRICVFVMLNPSTADAILDDPTIRRCIAFAKYWGYDGIRVVNLVAFRATRPTDMLVWFLTRSQEELTEHMRLAVTATRQSDVAKVVCAFGRVPPVMQAHAERVCRHIKLWRNLHAIKLNKDGSPAHPLYLRGDLVPVLYQPG